MQFQRKKPHAIPITPPSFVRIIDHTLGLTKYILGGTKIFTLVSLYPIYNLFTISYLSGVFVGHPPAMKLKHQYTNKGNRLSISFKRLKLFLARSYARFPSRLPRLRALCSFKQKKPHANPLPSFFRITDQVRRYLPWWAYILFTTYSQYLGQLPVMELKRQYTDKGKRT